MEGRLMKGNERERRGRALPGILLAPNLQLHRCTEYIYGNHFSPGLMPTSV